jgi:hypothetical protein
MLLCFLAHLFLLVVKRVTRVIGRGLLQAAVNEKELWTRPGLEETSESFYFILDRHKGPAVFFRSYNKRTAVTD